MAVKTSDRIVYPSRATAQQAIAGLRSHLGYVPEDSDIFLMELEGYANAKGIDFTVISSHSANECDLFRDDRFQQRKDAFGIGVTATGVPGASFVTYDDAAFYAVAEYCQKLRLTMTNDEVIRAKAINPVKFVRVSTLVASGSFPTVVTIDDLNTPFGASDYVWMADPNGPAAIVAKSRILFPDVPDQSPTPTLIPGGIPPMAELTYGLVPHPTMQDRIITNKPEGVGWNDLGQRKPYGVVLHRMLGTLRGTDSYFRQDGVGALTDYGVGVAGSDAATDDGLIMRWNDPRGRRAGWASGPVSAPYGDGLAFVNRFGINAVNRDLVSIEISGFQQTALTAKSRASIIGLMAYWADQCKIAWDTYPIGPDGFSSVYYHQEFTIGTGKECPFAVVMNETAALIEATRATLKKYQTAEAGTTMPKPTTPKPPTYAPPIIPDWVTADLKDGKPSDHVWTVEIDGKETRVEVFAAHRPYTMVKSANRLQLPFMGAEKVGPKLVVRETFMGRNAAKVNGKVFVQTEWGTWADNAAMTPRLSIRKA